MEKQELLTLEEELLNKRSSQIILDINKKNMKEVNLIFINDIDYNNFMKIIQKFYNYFV